VVEGLTVTDEGLETGHMVGILDPMTEVARTDVHGDLVAAFGPIALRGR